MKKFLSFLTLLLVAFVLPSKASAWDFSGNTDPSKVVLYFSKPDGNVGDKTMSYDSTNKCWYYEFTPADTYINYYLKVWNSNQSYNTEYNKNSGPTSNGTWATVNLETVSGETYYLSGLQKGVKCRIEITGATKSGTTERIQVRYVQTADDISYDIWGNFPAASSTWNSTSMTNVSGSEWVAENVVVTTTSNFGIRQLTNGSQSAWISASGTSSITASGSFNCQTNGTNFSIAPGTWTLTFDSSTKELTAELQETTPETLYLITTGTAGTKSAAIDGTTFTYSGVYFHAGDQMYLSTDANGASGTNYGPSSNSDLIDSNEYSFDKVDSNYWVAPVDGTYEITVDWENSTFTATWEEDIPTDMHLFVNGELKRSTILDGTLFLYPDVELAAGDKLILSTMSNASTGIYTPGSETTLVYTEPTQVTYSDNGYWVAPVNGYYGITVDWSDKTLMASWSEVMPDAMYLFVNGTKVEPATAESGDFTYEIELTKGAQLVLSTEADGATGTYTPGEVVELQPDVLTNFTLSDTGYWTAPVNGTYKISVSFANKTLSATWEADLPTLYLYSNTPSWATKIATLNSKTGVYTAVVKMGAGSKFVLSTKNATGTDYNGLKNEIYTHGSGETTLVSGEASSFSNTNDGCWVAPESGEYTLTIDWNNKTLTATWETPVKRVHMPLSEADFEGGKKHYFLVGNRMGEWRLLPEWELKADANGDMVLNNRWFYPGGFAIGVVDNYADYIKHTYTYYCTSYAFKDNYLSCTTDFSGNGVKWTATGTMGSPSNNFWTEFSSSLGGGDYWEAIGTLVTEVKVGLNSSGLPKSLTMTVGDKATANKYRFFTLVGDGIYNNNYCNSYGTGTTLQYSKGQTSDDGWQEGWIQYDQKTLEPYVDGNYNYLYHTSYTPDYFTANPALFNQTLADGSEFPYTSNEAQFVDYNNFDDLDSDPYREFYKSFADSTETIKDGVQKTGNGFNFIVETVNGDVTPGENNKWGCYVVRDMWINGEIKIWTGWGGNDRRSGGSDKDGSTWHGENGGPATAGLQVQGYDINSGQTVKLYNNEKNVDNTNYKVSDGEPVYFNRVILWYNIDEGIGNSFVQFIQESYGPAIYATKVRNEIIGKVNNLAYNWYLNPAQDEVDLEREVIGFKIKRYKYDDVQKNNGDVIIEVDSIAETYGVTVKVKDLLEENAGDFEFTSCVEDNGGNGFAAGMYYYDIEVTYDGNITKTAVSNKVPIYDNNVVAASALPLQLVKLSDEGKDKLDVTQNYLTYNPVENGLWFVLDVEETKDAEGNKSVKPTNGALIDGTKALNFMTENQDKYDFTSNFYITCLDYTNYVKTFQEYMTSGLVTDKTVPPPTVNVHDGFDAESDAYLFALGDNKYYSAVLMRKGSLEKREAHVSVSYSYTDADGNPVDEYPANSVEMQPVTPYPYNPTYSYEIVPYVETSGYDYINVTAPLRSNNSFAVPLQDTETSANVATTEGELTTNLLVLNVTYNRPNVDSEILSIYDVEENVSIVDELGYSGDFWYYYPEDKAAEVEHVLSMQGISPYNDSEPNVNFYKTRYLPKDELKYSETPNATFGNGIKFAALHEIESFPGAGLDGVHLGSIVRDEGQYDWMYKGHESLEDKAPTLVATGSDYESHEDQTIAPKYYLYELSNGADDKAYEFLVEHSACDHRTGDVVVDEDNTGFILNDEDPLIGTYVAKGFVSSKVPTVYVSSIYLFSNPRQCLIDGEIPTALQSDTNTLAVDLPTQEEMAAGNVGGMPDSGTEIEAGSFIGWAVKGQTYSNVPDKVTGVEDVLAGEAGEAVYYNLQGIRVDNPSAAGVYIRVQGKEVGKVVIK